MNRQHEVLWVLQWLFGLYFIAIGVMHFVVPAGLPEPMSWFYDLHGSLHVAAGTAEILGGAGLILPGLTRILPGLTVLAAAGLVVVMLAAAVWHAARGELLQVVLNLVTAAPLAYLAYGRWKLRPLAPGLSGTFGADPQAQYPDRDERARG